MLTKIVKGKNFDGVLRYIFSKPKAKLVCQNLQGTTISERVSEFNEISSQRKRVQRPVFHVSLSLPKVQEVSKGKWKRIVNYYLLGMGFDDCRYVAVRHRDREHDHVHIVASRVTNNGLLVSDSWDYLKTQAVARQIEKRYHLTPTPSSNQCLATSPTVRERRSGVESVRTRLQKQITLAAFASKSVSELVERLKEQEIQVSFKMEGSFRKGIIYHYQNLHFSGSNLGRGFSEYGLNRYLLGHSNESYPTIVSNPSPWLTQQQALLLYRKYGKDAETLAQIAQKALLDRWNWDSIRFILAQGEQFNKIKQKIGRRMALKYLNVVIASVSDESHQPKGIEFEKLYVSQHLNIEAKSSNELTL
uniref:Relaxase/mobilization nuclease family protein n=1 Tax=Gloeothece verrucosa (strain PCC 7822) TaxID=497965 RepID=E0UMA7_GLOV7|nr:Relaxase/mobilization nuclease family protein [Gloeothece verrucosa PCC 7822]